MMTRDEALGNSYTPKGLVRATANGFLFDYIAQWYYQMDQYELKEVLLAVLGVSLDKAEKLDEEKEYHEALLEELGLRDFGLED